MKKELINTIEQGMLGILNNEQLAKFEAREFIKNHSKDIHTK